MNTFAHNLLNTTQTLRQKKPGKLAVAIFMFAKQMFTLTQAFKHGHLHR